MVLDYLKGFSALYIVLHHMRDYFPIQEISKPLLSFGQEAVVVFLLISGFTNFYSLNRTEFKFGLYIRKKIQRIYPLLLFTLLVTWMIGGMSWGGYKSICQLVGNVLNLSSVNADVFFEVRPWMSNLPLWLLTYIWWYYFLIGLYKRFIGDGEKLIGVFLLIAIVGEVTYKLCPTVISLILIYSFILATGSYVCWCIMHEVFTLKRVFGIVGAYISIMAIHCLLFLNDFMSFTVSQHFQFPYCEIRHFGVATLLIVLIYVIKCFHLTSYFEIVFKPFGVLASFSYALYIIHFNLKTLMSIDIGINPYLQLILTIIIICTIAYFMEVYLQKWVVGLFARNKQNKHL